MIRYQQIVHARALLEHKNFRKAAESENISQPAFSRSIANLESSLGVTLFNRQRGNVSPTSYGEILAKHLGSILGATSEFEREINIFKELGGGELSVAMAPYPAELSGFSAIGKLTSEYPDIKCKVTSSDWYDVERLVIERKADLGLAELSEAKLNSDLEVEILGQHKFGFFCRSGHPLLQNKTIRKDDFNNFPLVLIKLPIRLSPYFPGKLTPEEGTTNVLPPIQIQDLYQSRKIIRESDAFSAATPLQIVRELEEGEFQFLPYTAPWMVLNYGFIYERGRLLSPAAIKFMDIVKEIEQQVLLRNDVLYQKYIPS